MEADREADIGPTGQPLLAAQIVAVRSEIKLALISHAEARPVTVVHRRHPLMAGVFGALAADRRGTVGNIPIAVDTEGVGVGDHEYRMRRARSGHPPPRRLCAAIAAAIDDDALAPLA